MAAPTIEYRLRIPRQEDNRSPDDWIVHLTEVAFGATDDTIEVDVPLENVINFQGSAKVAAQTTAGEYAITSDGVISSDAITVARQGHTDGAIAAYCLVIGKPVVATTAGGSL